MAKIAGHSMKDSEVFASLVDNMQKRGMPLPDLIKQASRQQDKSEFSDFFSTMTEEDYVEAKRQDLDDVIKELQFAADELNVKISAQHMGEFIDMAKKDHLRGVKLERAARKFCDKIATAVKPIDSNITKMARPGEMPSSMHSILNASSHPDDINVSKTGKLMGSESNPCSIWNQGSAMEELATKTSNDEITKKKLEAIHKDKIRQNQEMWQGIAEKLSTVKNDKSITLNSEGADQPEVSHNPKLSENQMSMFSNNEAFKDLKETTDGEKLADYKQQKKEAAEQARLDKQQIKPAEKINKTPNSIFGGSMDHAPIEKNSLEKSALDKFFENL